MHVHTSALEFLITGAYLIIWLFFFRLVQAKWSESAIGKALGALNG